MTPERELEILKKEEELERKEVRLASPEMLSEIKMQARAAFIQEVGNDMFDIIKALKKSAKGEAWAEKVTNNGTRVLYNVPMSIEAAIYLVNQMIGKPTETVEHTGHVSLRMDI